MWQMAGYKQCADDFAVGRLQTSANPEIAAAQARKGEGCRQSAERGTRSAPAAFAGEQFSAY
jgi:hypothetical protein